MELGMGITPLSWPTTLFNVGRFIAKMSNLQITFILNQSHLIGVYAESGWGVMEVLKGIYVEYV
jgi:hypothetical protein